MNAPANTVRYVTVRLQECELVCGMVGAKLTSRARQAAIMLFTLRNVHTSVELTVCSTYSTATERYSTTGSILSGKTSRQPGLDIVRTGGMRRARTRSHGVRTYADVVVRVTWDASTSDEKIGYRRQAQRTDLNSSWEVDNESKELTYVLRCVSSLLIV